MKRILLTGGRAPATLELARLFHAAGYAVFIAESMKYHLCRLSRAIVKNYCVPPPHHCPRAFIEALIDIVRREQIDLVIPTCEEIFYIAMGRDRLRAFCEVFVEDIEKLRILHNKWTFIQRAQHYGLPVPRTQLITRLEDVQTLLESGCDIVLKPVYSRFAVKTVILPRHTRDISRLTVNQQTPWVIQEFVVGMQLCTYSIVHEGRITAHSTYASEFRAGQGATIVFQPLEHPSSFAWVKHFVERERFTGQIAFDFIEDRDKKVVALECNPRATSGIHLFAKHTQFPQAFFNPSLEMIVPPLSQSAALIIPMALYGLPAVRSWAGLKRWASTLFSSRDVIFSLRDPLPWLLQWLPLGNLLYWSFKHRVSALEASTLDIEWNGL